MKTNKKMAPMLGKKRRKARTKFTLANSLETTMKKKATKTSRAM